MKSKVNHTPNPRTEKASKKTSIITGSNTSFQLTPLSYSEAEHTNSTAEKTKKNQKTKYIRLNLTIDRRKSGHKSADKTPTTRPNSSKSNFKFKSLKRK